MPEASLRKLVAHVSRSESLGDLRGEAEIGWPTARLAACVCSSGTGLCS